LFHLKRPTVSSTLAIAGGGGVCVHEEHMTTYLVCVRPEHIIAEDIWPQSRVGCGIEIDANTAAEAIHEVSDETGISGDMLTAYVTPW
jgi:hypothetical protein